MWNFADLNWLAILTATIAGFVIGGVWYGPLFGKAWMEAIGLKPEDIKPSMKPYVISFVTALITAIVLALLIAALGITSAVDGVLIGLAVGVGFIATAMGSDAAFGGTGLTLFLIQAGYRVSYAIVMGLILTLWS